MAEHTLQWLEQAGGWYDSYKIGIKDYSDVGMGMGAVALDDIEVCTHPTVTVAGLNLLIQVY